MSHELIGILCFVCAFVGALLMASRSGKKSAQIEALKQELKKNAEEQSRERQITNSVNALSADDARRRLHEVANRKK